MIPYALAGIPRVQEREPWGGAYTTSVGIHLALIFFFIFAPMKREIEVKNMITDITYIEKEIEPIVVKEKVEQMDAPALVPRPKKKELVKKKIVQPIQKKVVKIPSPKGTVQEKVVTNIPISGPIIDISKIGIVGKKKASLKSLAGSMESKRAKNLMALPTHENGNTQNILLARGDLKDIQKREQSLGIPLLSQKIEAKAQDKKLKLAKLDKKKKREQLRNNPLEKDRWGNKKGPFSMEGPLKYRKILKMNLPPYPRWAEEKGIETSVSFRLWVNPKGRVKDNMYLEKASGYSELDYLAKDAISRFIFVPLPKDQVQEDEWGVATFRFELKE